jgi:hypothetical protein
MSIKHLAVPFLVLGLSVYGGCSSDNGGGGKGGQSGSAAGHGGTTGTGGAAGHGGTTGTGGAAGATGGSGGATGGSGGATGGSGGATAGSGGRGGSGGGTAGSGGATGGSGGATGGSGGATGGSGGATGGSGGATGGSGGGTGGGGGGTLMACTTTTAGGTDMLSAAAFCENFLANCGSITNFSHTGFTDMGTCVSSYNAFTDAQKQCRSYHLCWGVEGANGSNTSPSPTNHCAHTVGLTPNGTGTTPCP